MEAGGDLLRIDEGSGLLMKGGMAAAGDAKGDGDCFCGEGGVCREWWFQFISSS